MFLTKKLQGNIKEVIFPKLAEGKFTVRLGLPDVFVYVENANPEVLAQWVTILTHIKDQPKFGMNSLFLVLFSNLTDLDDYLDQQQKEEL